MPVPIRLSRARGYRKPEGAAVVTRPGPFGNPFKLLPPADAADKSWRIAFAGSGPNRPDWATEVETGRHASEVEAAGAAVAACRRWLLEPAQAKLLERGRRELRGKDLACWCPLDQPCHRDVWLELANTDETAERKGYVSQ